MERKTVGQWWPCAECTPSMHHPESNLSTLGLWRNKLASSAAEIGTKLASEDKSPGLEAQSSAILQHTVQTEDSGGLKIHQLNWCINQTLFCLLYTLCSSGNRVFIQPPLQYVYLERICFYNTRINLGSEIFWVWSMIYNIFILLLNIQLRNVVLLSILCDLFEGSDEKSVRVYPAVQTGNLQITY